MALLVGEVKGKKNKNSKTRVSVMSAGSGRKMQRVHTVSSPRGGNDKGKARPPPSIIEDEKNAIPST